jgi:hypothetical protein
MVRSPGRKWVEHYSDNQLLDHYLDGLRKAGLPE